MSYHSRNPSRMSLEQALEEDRREILDLLEGRRYPSSGSSSSSAQKKDNNNVGQAPRVRSLLDIPSASPPSRHGSISGRGHAVRRSIERVPSSPLRLSSSAASSPTPEDPPSSVYSDHSRRSSDGTDLALHGQRHSVDRPRAVDIHRDYQFNMQPSVSKPDLQRRVTQTADKTSSKAGQNRRSGMLPGLDLRVSLPGFSRGRDSTRRSSARGMSLDSRSPSGFGRSLSPVNWLNSNPFSSTPKPEKIITEKGKVINMNSAYKHLSDAALANSPGSLSALAKPGPDPASQGDGRLEKDLFDSENNPLDSSDEEADDSTSSDDDAAIPAPHGILKRRQNESLDIGSTTTGIGPDSSNTSTEPQSLLAAAEEERKMVEGQYKVKPLAEPEPKQSSKKSNVHPRTSYDQSTSTANTPFGSEDEAELSDIKRAQQLSIQMSAIDNSIRHRSVRTIVRGDFNRIQEEAEEGRRRQRKYLVATDLSEESVYALEWTIGTILRDGDTMFAVYASHEETGKDTEAGSSRASQDGGSQPDEETVNTNDSQSDLSTYLPRALFGRFGGTTSGTESKAGSIDSHAMSKAESERVNAVEVISQTCVRLLRKTLLQVRVAVEVIHCKSPKHMITEAIDGLEPTLVIVGARGRSALKGVLLGSFSNYLVTNSSVPVMVARKKLKKQTKQKKTNIRLSNNLTTPKKLASAKVD